MVTLNGWRAGGGGVADKWIGEVSVKSKGKMEKDL